MSASLVFHDIGLWLVLKSLFQHVLNVGNGAALARFGKLERDERVEAHAACAEERQVVHDAIVECLNLGAVDNVNCLLHIHRDAQVPSQSVSASAGNDAQRCIRVSERACHLVYGSVATYGYAYVISVVGTCLCNFSCMSSIFGKHNILFEAIFAQILFYEFCDAFLAMCTRYRIHNERDSHFFVLHNAAKLRKMYEFPPKSALFLISFHKYYEKNALI